jgi:hypothetical protein
MMARNVSGFVIVSTYDGQKITLTAERADPVASLRGQANDLRQRAADMLARAGLMDQAADRLS